MKKNELKNIVKEALREVIKEEFSLAIVSKTDAKQQSAPISEGTEINNFREKIRNLQENQIPYTAVEGSSLPPGEIGLDTIAKLMKS